MLARPRAKGALPAALQLLLVVVSVLLLDLAHAFAPASSSASTSSSILHMASTGGSGDKGMGEYGAIDPNKLSFKPAEKAEQGPDPDIFSKPPKSWPELVGVDGEEAKKRIEEDIPGLRVQILPEGSFVTRDYRLDRVRVFVNEAGKVAGPPSQG